MTFRLPSRLNVKVGAILNADLMSAIKNVLYDTVKPALTTLVQQRSRRATVLVAALAVSGAGGVLAVASLAPDAADLPVHEVLEPVALPGTTQSLGPAQAGLAELAQTLYRSDVSRASDTPETLLKRLGVNDPAAAQFLRSNALVRKSLLGRTGRSLSLQASTANTLQSLSVRWVAQDDGKGDGKGDGNFNRLVVEKTPGNGTGFGARLEAAPLLASTRLGSGTISSSLFAATDDARLPDAIAVQLAEIFAGDIDFHRALRKGDRFSVTYEALEADGEVLRTGRVLSAEFVNRGKTYQAMWFAQPGQTKQSGKGSYFTFDGKSLNRSFLASPLEFSRVTSGFKMRLHPILQTWRQHLGVDYAAPTGTAVRAMGDGTVEFAGVQRGFGNVVIIDHDKHNSTVYAHLSRIDVRKGEKISQGQHIGAVGTTGWATGPHLHFEFRVDGIHHDPLTMAQKNEATPVTAQVRPEFDRAAAMNRLALASASAMQNASAD